jgi:hypothetical protein
MALLVELVGAPGAGKSTVAAALDGLRAGGAVLRPATDLVRPPRRGLPREAARRLAGAEDPRVLRRALADRAEAWDPLLRLVLAARPDDPRGAALRLEALDWTRRTLATVALVRAAPGGAFVLDEGPLQRVTAVLGPLPDPVEVARYVGLLPPSDLVLHLKADDATLARRLADRAAAGRVIDRHLGLDPAARLASVRADAAVLAAAVGAAATGTTVIDVDASDGADPIAAARAAVLRQLGPAPATGA